MPRATSTVPYSFNQPRHAQDMPRLLTSPEPDMMMTAFFEYKNTSQHACFSSVRWNSVIVP